MTRRLSFEFVYGEFSKRNCELLEDKYINARTHMRYICSLHPNSIKQTTWDLFRKSKNNCNECEAVEISKRKTKYTIEHVRNNFNSRGMTLIDEKYKNTETPLKYICIFHPSEPQFIRYGNFLEGQGCKHCGIENQARSTKLAQEVVFSLFADNGLIIREGEKYINAKTPIRVQCIKHLGQLQTINYDSLKSGHGCRYCGIERRSGINSPNYNPKLTVEDRIRKRYNKENSDWRTSVFIRDNYTCQCCGQHGGTLNAHHKNGYDTYISDRYLLENGVTLCKNCHLDFHRTYGRGGNTEHQYHEFILMKKIHKVHESNKGVAI